MLQISVHIHADKLKSIFHVVFVGKYFNCSI